MSDDNEIDMEALREEALELATKQVSELGAYYRIIHWLSTYNQNYEISTALSGGALLSDAILQLMAFGFTKSDIHPKSFFIHLQTQEYEEFSRLPLDVAWLADDGLVLYFKQLWYMDYKLPPLIITVPIKNTAVLAELKTCEFVTFSHIKPSPKNQGMFVVHNVVNPPVELFLQAPSGQTKQVGGFMKAFH